MTETHIDERARQLLELFEGDMEAAIAALRQTAGRRLAASKKKSRVAIGEILVETTDLVKTYKIGKQRIEALRGVSLQVREGEFVAFTGPSGSGKSTLLQLIGGLDKPSQGTVVVDNKDLTKLSDRKLSIFRNQAVGFVFQFFYLQPFLRLEANLEVPGMFARVKKRDRAAQASELAEAVSLQDRLRHLPKELSGGQMQRAAIARAMFNRPKLILADEPTGNLDSANGKAIIDLFEKMRNEFGTTIIIVTHDPKVAGRADREIAMEDGRILV